MVLGPGQIAERVKKFQDLSIQGRKATISPGGRSSKVDHIRKHRENIQRCANELGIRWSKDGTIQSVQHASRGGSAEKKEEDARSASQQHQEHQQAALPLAPVYQVPHRYRTNTMSREERPVILQPDPMSPPPSFRHKGQSAVLQRTPLSSPGRGARSLLSPSPPTKRSPRSSPPHTISYYNSSSGEMNYLGSPRDPSSSSSAKGPPALQPSDYDPPVFENGDASSSWADRRPRITDTAEAPPQQHHHLLRHDDDDDDDIHKVLKKKKVAGSSTKERKKRERGMRGHNGILATTGGHNPRAFSALASIEEVVSEDTWEEEEEEQQFMARAMRESIHTQPEAVEDLLAKWREEHNALQHEVANLTECGEPLGACEISVQDSFSDPDAVLRRIKQRLGFTTSPPANAAHALHVSTLAQPIAPSSTSSLFFDPAIHRPKDAQPLNSLGISLHLNSPAPHEPLSTSASDLNDILRRWRSGTHTRGINERPDMTTTMNDTTTTNNTRSSTSTRSTNNLVLRLEDAPARQSVIPGEELLHNIPPVTGNDVSYREENKINSTNKIAAVDYSHGQARGDDINIGGTGGVLVEHPNVGKQAMQQEILITTSDTFNNHNLCVQDTDGSGPSGSTGYDDIGESAARLPSSTPLSLTTPPVEDRHPRALPPVPSLNLEDSLSRDISNEEKKEKNKNDVVADGGGISRQARTRDAQGPSVGFTTTTSTTTTPTRLRPEEERVHNTPPTFGFGGTNVNDSYTNSEARAARGNDDDAIIDAISPGRGVNNDSSTNTHHSLTSFMENVSSDCSLVELMVRLPEGVNMGPRSMRYDEVRDIRDSILTLSADSVTPCFKNGDLMEQAEYQMESGLFDSVDIGQRSLIHHHTHDKLRVGNAPPPKTDDDSINNRPCESVMMREGKRDKGSELRDELLVTHKKNDLPREKRVNHVQEEPSQNQISERPMNGKILASRAAEGEDEERKNESTQRHGGRESWTNWEREESEGNRTRETKGAHGGASMQMPQKQIGSGSGGGGGSQARTCTPLDCAPDNGDRGAHEETQKTSSSYPWEPTSRLPAVEATHFVGGLSSPLPHDHMAQMNQSAGASCPSSTPMIWKGVDVDAAVQTSLALCNGLSLATAPCERDREGTNAAYHEPSAWERRIARSGEDEHELKKRSGDDRDERRYPWYDLERILRQLPPLDAISLSSMHSRCTRAPTPFGQKKQEADAVLKTYQLFLQQQQVLA